MFPVTASSYQLGGVGEEWWFITLLCVSAVQLKSQGRVFDAALLRLEKKKKPAPTPICLC